MRGKVSGAVRKHEEQLLLALTMEEFKEADWFLDRQLGTFDGGELTQWSGFFLSFSELLLERGWNGLPAKVQFQLLMCRMTGTAKVKLMDWARADPSIKTDMLKLEAGFPRQLPNFKDPWELLIDLQNIQMLPGEDVVSYNSRYLALSRQVNAETRDAAQYLFSLPDNYREQLHKRAESWPLTLPALMDFVKDTVVRDRAIECGDYDRNPGVFEEHGQLGHWASHCPSNQSQPLRLQYINGEDPNKQSDPLLFFDVTLLWQDRRVPVRALIDSGATKSFMSEEFAQRNAITVVRCPTEKIEFAQRGSLYKTCYRTGDMLATAAGYSESLSLLVIKHLSHDVILGLDWLTRNQPTIDWPRRILVIEAKTVPETIVQSVANGAGARTLSPYASNEPISIMDRTQVEDGFVADEASRTQRSHRHGKANILDNAPSRRRHGTDSRDKNKASITGVSGPRSQASRDSKRAVATDEERRQIMQSRHLDLTSGHHGKSKTIELIRREFYWPKMNKDIREFIANCDTCQRMRASCHRLHQGGPQSQKQATHSKRAVATDEERPQITQSRHLELNSGHLGKSKTIKLARRDFTGPIRTSASGNSISAVTIAKE